MKGDLFESRRQARAMARALQHEGHQAVVEQSGTEFRVRIRHPHWPDTIAYLREDDLKPDSRNLHWVRK